MIGNHHTKRCALRVLWLALAALHVCTGPVRADSTIDPVNRYSWCPNAGWIDWRGDVERGADFNRSFAAGFLWSANVGWINLGNGPLNGLGYTNASAADFGVNVDYTSNPGDALLSGFGWSANAGWINFDVAAAAGAANRPRISKTTGVFSGYAWSANLGWINLNPSLSHQLQTTIRLISLSQAQAHILGILTLTGEQFDQADANSDGAIDVTDLILLVNMGF